MIQAKCRVGQSAGQDPSCAVSGGLPGSRPGAGSGSLPGKTHHVNWKLLKMYAGFPGLTGRVRTI